MKKINLLLLLPLIASVSSCGGNVEPIEEKLDKTKVIFNLLDNVNVKAEGKETITYLDEKYSYLNSTNYVNVDRDFSNIKEADGSLTPAIRENTHLIFDTFLRGEKGQTIREVLTKDNKVVNDDLLVNGSSILFNELFANPFLSIDENDIGDDLSLNLTKANYIVESYTGYQRAVKSAKLNVSNNYATGIDFEFFDRKDGIPEGYGFTYYISTFDLDLKFDYDVTPIVHLNPRSNNDEIIKNALNNESNFTMTIASDILAKDAIYYVCDDFIYLHFGSKDIGPADKDIFYKKVNDNKYESYIYKSSISKFNIDDLDVKLEEILPNLNEINSNILLKESDDVYSIDKIAAKLALNSFVAPYFSVEDGLGTNGSITLKDGKISTFRGTFNPFNPFNIYESFYDYGTTTLPTWLDTSLIK